MYKVKVTMMSQSFSSVMWYDHNHQVDYFVTGEVKGGTMPP